MQLQPQKKRGTWIFISAACFLMIGMAVVLLVFSQNKFSNVGQTIADAKGNQPDISITELDSDIKNVKLYAESYEASHTTYMVEYPQVEDEKFNETILNFVNEEKEQFLALAVNNENVTKKDLNTFTLSISTYEFNERFYSFVFHARTELGTKVPTEKVTTFIYDSETTQVMTLQQLLDNNIRYLETFNQYIHEQLISNSDLKKTLVDETTLQKVIAPLWDNYTTFAIEKDELVVYFQPGTVAESKQGIVTVRGKMSYLQSILAEPFRTELTEATETLPLAQDNRKRVALTFDDGPHPKVTEQILAILDEFDAKATFFMLGNKIEQYPEIAQDAKNRGHEIGNHTWTHPVLTKLPIDEVKEEFNKTENIIFDTIGEHSTVFRPPFGATNDEIKALFSVSSVNWSIDTLDWKHRNSQKILQILKANMHNNAVVLMHDIHQPTADGLRAVMQYLQDEGYEFLTVSEVLPYVEFNM